MLYCYLDKSFNFLVRKPLKVPKRNDLFYSFLAGYADADGSWVIKGKNGRVYFTFEIGSKGSELLRQIKEKLEENGYHPSLTSIMKKETEVGRSSDTNENFHALSLTRREEVIHLADRILEYSRHEEKVAKIKLMLKVKNKKRWSEVKDEVEDLRDTVNSVVMSAKKGKWMECVLFQACATLV